MISVHFQGKPFSITVIQVYTPTTNADIEWFFEDLQDLLELTSKKKKRCAFHHRGLEWKGRKSRDTWSNRQIWPWNTKRSRSRECTGHSKHPLPTTQEKTLHGHHQMVNTKIRLIIFFVAKDGALCSQQKQDQGLRSWTLYCKIQAYIEESRKTTRPFRYDLNQIPYDYIVEVTNRFKGLDQIDRVSEELWTEVHDIVQETVIKNIPTKKEMQKGKDKVWGGLINSWQKKRS